MVEVGVDVARDASGRWRHPARWHRARPALSPPPADVPRLTSSPHDGGTRGGSGRRATAERPPTPGRGRVAHPARPFEGDPAQDRSRLEALAWMGERTCCLLFTRDHNEAEEEQLRDTLTTLAHRGLGYHAAG